MTDGPDSAEMADAASAWRSAYVHVPFCWRRCPYCDFAVVTEEETPRGGTEAYFAALRSEIAMAPEWGPLDAVNFGGGTPSRAAPAMLGRILRDVADRSGLVPDAEVSLEANPEDWSLDLADRLLGEGFTRVSLGVQSFDDDVLGRLGRWHSAAEAAAAVRSAKRAGFESVSVDLIYGTPGETEDSWRATVETALELGIHHLSAYALTVEPGTELARTVREGARAPDPDEQADRYEHLAAATRAAGLVRYEVSNWARRDHHCRYNLATWSQAEFDGFGLGAHDHRQGVRHRNHRVLRRYLAAVAAGRRPVAGTDALDAHGRELERVMLGLRRAGGVVAGKAGEALTRSPDGTRLLEAGVLARRAGRIVVTKPLLTDEVSRAVLSLSPGEC